MVLCPLLEGDIGGFSGVNEPGISEADACLGVETRRGWLPFFDRVAEYRTFSSGPDSPETWLFATGDGRVELAEVYRLPRDATPAVLFMQLGSRGDEIEFPLAARLQRPIIEPEESAVEYVHAARGLAILVARRDDEAERVVRLRAFAAMPLQQYVDRFVRLLPVHFEPP